MRFAATVVAGMLAAAGCSRLPITDPLSAEDRMALGARYERLGLRANSAREYEAARRQQRGFVPAYIALGNLAFEDGEWVEAESFYRQALRLAPDHAAANNGLALVHLARGRKLPAAEKLALRALKAGGPYRAYALDTLAQIYARQGRWARARAALAEARRSAESGDLAVLEQLERSRRQIEAAAAAAGAMEMIEQDIPDLLIADIYLPGTDGLALCRQLRRKAKTKSLPVIFITGHDTPYTAAEALEAGGDDFIRKPFAVRELTARLRAHLRRLNLGGGEETLPLIRIFPDTRVVTVDEREVELTQVEYELLAYLCSNPTKLHSTQDLLVNVWQYPVDAGDAALVRNHIRNLRRKLEDTPDRPEIIQSRHGRGYTIKALVEFAQSVARA